MGRSMLPVKGLICIGPMSAVTVVAISVIAQISLALAPVASGDVLGQGSDLVYMHNRFYDPVLGRFISPDPANLSVHIGGNRYAYTANNPITLIDNNGMSPNYPSWKDEKGHKSLSAYKVNLVILNKYLSVNSHLEHNGPKWDIDPKWAGNMQRMIDMATQIEEKRAAETKASQMEINTATIPELSFMPGSYYWNYTPMSKSQEKEYSQAIHQMAGIDDLEAQFDALKFQMDTQARGDAYGFNEDSRGEWETYNGITKDKVIADAALKGLSPANIWASVSLNVPSNSGEWNRITFGQVAGTAFGLTVAGKTWMGVSKILPWAASQVGVAYVSIQMPKILDGDYWNYANQNWYYYGRGTVPARQAYTPQDAAGCATSVKAC